MCMVLESIIFSEALWRRRTAGGNLRMDHDLVLLLVNLPFHQTNPRTVYGINIGIVSALINVNRSRPRIFDTYHHTQGPYNHLHHKHDMASSIVPSTSRDNHIS